MKVLFLTLLDFENIEEHNIYTDLLREFYKNGHTEWFKSTIDEAHIIRAIESIINSLT